MVQVQHTACKAAVVTAAARQETATNVAWMVTGLGEPNKARSTLAGVICNAACHANLSVLALVT